MASVLSFAPRTTMTSPKPLPAGASASIIIFPGVRYERLDDSGPHTSGASGGKRAASKG